MINRGSFYMRAYGCLALMLVFPGAGFSQLPAEKPLDLFLNEPIADDSLPAAQPFKSPAADIEINLFSEGPQGSPDSGHFPKEVEYWLKRREEYDLGIREAESLRARLLQPPPYDGQGVTNGNTTKVELVAVLIDALQHQLAETDGAESIADFRVTKERLTNQLQGKQAIRSESVFESFSGRWYGVWQKMAVNHDWRPSRIPDKPTKTSEPNVFLCADQYAWIHNGFGWNYLVSSDNVGLQKYILGQVYYLDEHNRKQINGRKPHVGYVDLNDTGQPPTRLVWITESEVFLEEIFPQADAADDYYVITAIYHQLLADSPNVSSIATQAKYTRKSNHRPRFIEIPWMPPAKFCNASATPKL